MTARVLVVDDILANIKLLEARLVAEYFEVLTATSGEAALEICARERVDVILLDVMMPGMDGFEACRRIKASKATQRKRCSRPTLRAAQAAFAGALALV